MAFLFPIFQQSLKVAEDSGLSLKVKWPIGLRQTTYSPGVNDLLVSATSQTNTHKSTSISSWKETLNINLSSET